MPQPFAVMEIPDFELRGSVLYLMKDGGYDWKLTPEEFPFFFDRELMTRYLDMLFEHRYNTIFLWAGHLFPSIAEMPEYPDATDLSIEELLRNQEQFRWFTNECARRHIRLLLHFYSIHIPRAMAEARGIPAHYAEPNEFVTRYTKYALDRFLVEFKDVGLYVCPGEALKPEHQPAWIRDVVFAAAKECGHNPVVVVRSWMVDKDKLREAIYDSYDNAYTELKHNIEMIVSPVPDYEHAEWRGVAKKHIVNLHEVSDIKPFRWGSPAYIREMALEWKKTGLDGAEIYGPVSWRWPYTLDKLEPGQSGYWPEGPKLNALDRDWIWYEAFGRYLWHANRDPETENLHWEKQLAGRFGENAAPLVRQWYEVTGPVLPGLQNLTVVQNMNWHPTAVGKNQNVDHILAARTPDGGHWDTGSGCMPSMPVDTLFFERYKRRFGQTDLTDRVSLPVSAWAEHLSKGTNVDDRMTPDLVALLCVELAEEGLSLAREAAEIAPVGAEEIARFVSDSEALVLIAKIYESKVLAAAAKRAYEMNGEERFATEMCRQLDASVKHYTNLVAVTDAAYLTATDLDPGRFDVNWHLGLRVFERDREAQIAWLASTREVVPGVSAGALEMVLAAPVLDQGETLGQIRQVTRERIPPLEVPASRALWDEAALKLRDDLLERVFLRGVPAEWLSPGLQVEWISADQGGVIETGQRYRIRKLRYEALPGYWIPALLYEPAKPGARMPAVLNVNGHVHEGKATAYEQIRSINCAKRGMLVLHPEFPDLGELWRDGASPYYHEDAAVLDLCGVNSVSVFYLVMRRALDILLDHPSADPGRVVMTGLSGGGWQTTVLGALDTRIGFLAPNAGHIGAGARLDEPGNIGDLEQMPVDLLTVADYTHITALFAPRPALMIYNANDIHFPAPAAISSIIDPVRPVYRLYGRESDFEHHVNHDPGDHNYEIDNRQAFLRFVNRHFFNENERFDEDIPCGDEILTPGQLTVGLPKGNADWFSLGGQLMERLPLQTAPAPESGNFKEWREDALMRLEKVLRYRPVSVVASGITPGEGTGAFGATSVKLSIAERWSVPLVILEDTAGSPRGTVLLFGDAGRAALAEQAATHLREGRRVALVDLLGMGEAGVPFQYITMLHSAGERALGVQAGQVDAVVRHLREQDGAASGPIVHAVGPNASLAALCAVALGGGADDLIVEGLPDSLKTLVRDRPYVAVPAAYCFGLLREFDVHELLALCHGTSVEQR